MQRPGSDADDGDPTAQSAHRRDHPRPWSAPDITGARAGWEHGVYRPAAGWQQLRFVDGTDQDQGMTSNGNDLVLRKTMRRVRPCSLSILPGFVFEPFSSDTGDDRYSGPQSGSRLLCGVIQVYWSCRIWACRNSDNSSRALHWRWL